MAEITPATFRHTLRFLCATLMSSQVVLLLAAAAALGPDGFEEPPWWALAVVVALGLAEATVIGAVGYRVPAIVPGASAEDTRTEVAAGVRSTTILRFALAEAVALVSLGLAFVVGDGGTVVCTVGVLISLVLDGWHVWPGERTLTRLKDGFEREGGLSRLDEVLDAPPPSRRG